jgi:hypothetical protein
VLLLRTDFQYKGKTISAFGRKTKDEQEKEKQQNGKK